MPLRLTRLGLRFGLGLSLPLRLTKFRARVMVRVKLAAAVDEVVAQLSALALEREGALDVLCSARRREGDGEDGNLSSGLGRGYTGEG